ncbi:hypothetical protein ZEAMMB73_Zm00001d023555 [Zea mays]|uniref:Uncharacterized protein n=1 Tax=Zea mays TaxID=4577 RepID=A0A1D6IU38_MAIZE|nr:hypothetical protein ZEAMMB73_Zm00001d023555 [Zea mays]
MLLLSGYPMLKLVKFLLLTSKERDHIGWLWSRTRML